MFPGAYQTYLKAENDERLARLQFERAQILFDKGAIAKSALEQAEDCRRRCQGRPECRDRTVAAAWHRQGPSFWNRRHRRSHLRRDHRPASYQRGAACRGCLGRIRLPFLIFLMSGSFVTFTRMISTPCAWASTADIHLNAYPGKVFKGRIDNILPVLDPSIRTAKVRHGSAEPGTDAHRHVCYGDVLWRKRRKRTSRFPATAILHLHDREWVYTPIRRWTFQAPGSSDREHASRRTCRKWFQGSSREIRWSQMLWRCRTRWSNR